MSEENQKELLRLVRARLETIAKHTDNWTNGSLGRDSNTPNNSLKVADLVIEVACTEAKLALADLAALGV